ncbi:MAG: methyltransferase domain-containing protein [Polyangiaceae bacterium]|nr:methyltransferase domain-containing protein [Polyangiaceae bacterium]
MTYFHGYTSAEQIRLREQARILGRYTHHSLPLRGDEKLLEVGSGVGGQTALLAQLFPKLRITALERERSSHDAALLALENQPELAQRVQPVCGDVFDLPPGLAGFDAGYICWVLEHVSEPSRFLATLRGCFRPGATMIVQEVFGQSFRTEPLLSLFGQDYYSSYLCLQKELGGDPEIGFRLGALLDEAGYEEVEVSAQVVLEDQRSPRRRQEIFTYMGQLLASVEDSLVEKGYCQAGDGAKVAAELTELGAQEESIFFYTFVRALGRVPK